jgi:hypothetical protein
VADRLNNRPRRIEKMDKSPSTFALRGEEKERERLIITTLEHRMLAMLPSVKPRSDADLGPIFSNPPRQRPSGLSHSQSDVTLARPNRPKAVAIRSSALAANHNLHLNNTFSSPGLKTFL